VDAEVRDMLAELISELVECGESGSFSLWGRGKDKDFWTGASVELVFGWAVGVGGERVVLDL